MCQDTGIPLFFVKLGNGNYGVTEIEKGIILGTQQATKDVPLRPNVVHPLTRKNSGNNTGIHMPYINYTFHKEPYIELSVMMKGAGSENMSALEMLTPGQGKKGIKNFIVDTLVKAGSNPCPPVVLGIGIGGSADISMKLAKEALLRPVGKNHSEPEIAQLENELLTELNELGIGTMGLGGKVTVLGVNIEYAYCHTASLPVAVNVQCWADRRATARIYSDDKVEIVEPR